MEYFADSKKKEAPEGSPELPPENLGKVFNALYRYRAKVSKP